jgi:hypothetical protein
MHSKRSACRYIIPLLATLTLPIPDSEALGASPSTAESAAAEVNACTLLSTAEIAAIVHFKVEPGIRNDSGWIHGGPHDGSYSSTCLWKAAQDHDANNPSLPLGGSRFAILNIMSTPPGSQQAAKFLQDFRDAAQDQTIDMTPVALKIGDESLWWGDGVAVRKGNVSYGVSVHSVKERPQERQMEETLAAKVVARL